MNLHFLTDNASKYQSWYSSEKLFNKTAKYAKTAGLKVVYAALLLYYAIADKSVPLKDNVLVMGALGYTNDAEAFILAVKSIWDNIYSD